MQCNALAVMNKPRGELSMGNLVKMVAVAIAGHLVFGFPVFGQGVKNDVKRSASDLKAGFFDLFDKNSIDVNFDNGSSALSEGEKSDLTALIKGQDKNVKNLKLVIASWSDEDYPATTNKDLSDGSISLADKRGEAVATFLRTHKFAEVEKLNMAKHENRLLQWWGTEKSKVKDAVEQPTTKPKTEKSWVQYEAEVVRGKGGPNEVVVLVYDPTIKNK